MNYFFQSSSKSQSSFLNLEQFYSFDYSRIAKRPASFGTLGHRPCRAGDWPSRLGSRHLVWPLETRLPSADPVVHSSQTPRSYNSDVTSY